MTTPTFAQNHLNLSVIQTVFSVASLYILTKLVAKKLLLCSEEMAQHWASVWTKVESLAVEC